MGEPASADERVFLGLKYSAWHNLKLQQWVMKAGISKTITFHCARHTYATLQLTLGTDIYTVSKLLGHKPGLLENPELIEELTDQVYQFSRMCWKSVSQQSLPVTICYPEMVAEIFPHFESDTIPPFGQKNLWFL